MSMKEKTVTRLDYHSMRQYDAYIGRQQRRRKRLIRRLVLFSAIVVMTIGFMTTYHVRQHTLQADKKEQYEQLEKQLDSLKSEETKLNEEINLLNDDDYILEIARTNYFFSKEGELIFKILDESPSY